MKSQFTRLTLLAIFLSPIAFAWLTTPLYGQTIQWQTDVDTALEQAEKENRLVLLHFSASWCQPCKNLETFVFKSPRVVRVFDATVAAVNLDADQHQALVEKYDVKSVPFDVVLTAKGRVVLRRPSPRDSEGYIAMLNGLGKILDKVGANEDPAVTQQLNQLEELMAIEQAAFESERAKIKQTGPSHMMPRASMDSSNLKRFHDSRNVETPNTFQVDKPESTRDFVDNPFFGKQDSDAGSSSVATPERDRITPPSGIVNKVNSASNQATADSTAQTKENKFFHADTATPAATTNPSHSVNRKASAFQPSTTVPVMEARIDSNAFNFDLAQPRSTNSPSPTAKEIASVEKTFLPPEPPDFLREVSSTRRVVTQPNFPKPAIKPSTPPTQLEAMPRETNDNGFAPPKSNPVEIEPVDSNGFQFPSIETDNASLNKAKARTIPRTIPRTKARTDAELPSFQAPVAQPTEPNVEPMAPIASNEGLNNDSENMNGDASDQPADLAAIPELPEFDFNQNPLGLSSEKPASKPVDVQAVVWSAKTLEHPPRMTPDSQKQPANLDRNDGNGIKSLSAEIVAPATPVQSAESQVASEALVARTPEVRPEEFARVEGKLFAEQPRITSTKDDRQPTGQEFRTAVGELETPVVRGRFQPSSTNDTAKSTSIEGKTMPLDSPTIRSAPATSPSSNQRSFKVDVEKSKALLALTNDQKNETAPQAPVASSTNRGPVAIGVVSLNSNQVERLKLNQREGSTTQRTVAQVSNVSESHSRQNSDVSHTATDKPNYALNGKCPVTLMTEAKWIDGDPKIGCVHREQVYLFVDQAARDKFLSAPDNYSPLLAGFDPVLYLETGKLMEGEESFGIFMGKAPNQRIVLFVSPDTRQRFQASPAKYIENVRQAMSKK